jgi:hypothetical protein
MISRLIIIAVLALSLESCTQRRHQSLAMPSEPPSAPVPAQTSGPPVLTRTLVATGDPREAIVHLCITNYSFKGMTKLVEELPEGAEAFPVSSSSASFSFQDGKVKFMFVQVPSEEMLCVSYKLRSGNPLAEPLYPGLLTYIDDNEVKRVSVLPANIKVAR